MDQKPTDERAEMLAEGAMRVPEAVVWSGIGRSKLYTAMATGEILYVKVDRRRLIVRRSLLHYLAKRLQE